jgi:hypothetical protein
MSARRRRGPGLPAASLPRLPVSRLLVKRVGASWSEPTPVGPGDEAGPLLAVRALPPFPTPTVARGSLPARPVRKGHRVTKRPVKSPWAGA